MTIPLPRRRRARPERPPHVAPTARAEVGDVLVFERAHGGFALVGGTGRGAGWAGVVELELADDSVVGRSWRRGTSERISARRAVPITGPYYARHAVAVPVGQRHVVVLGGDKPIMLRDAELVSFAASAVDGIDGIPANKLLADELELVHALRALMDYRPLTIRETVRHIATVAATSLSCEVALIGVEHAGQVLVEGIDLRTMGPAGGPDGERHLTLVAQAAAPLLEQAAAADPDVFGVEVAARLTLPLGGAAGAGALALGHAVARPRGFTSLCQRIARAIAEGAELLVSQAQAREQLASELDLLARLIRTDSLTGSGNRHAWDAEVTAWRAADERSPAHVLSCDLDGLKEVNDRFGHAAGDALICGAANLLRSSVRECDLVARVGGDEFVVLLRGADATVARRITARLRRAERAWRVTEHALMPRLSLGLARVADGDLEGARAAADRSMYSNKRRRLAGPTGHSDRPWTDRRTRPRPDRPALRPSPSPVG
ncbi:MAG: GGDEF domain-containing protein [Chloroflexi bacterium]|nr:GGDEF domain-containing protein [Chloroflexota bacterium]